MLEFSKNRGIAKFCPCGKVNNNRFAPDINNINFGHCFTCDKTFFPSSNGLLKCESVIQIQKPTSYIDQYYLTQSLNKEVNNFLKFLNNRFTSNQVKTITDRLPIGNSKRWGGSTIFWQVDENLKIRSGKVLKYDPITGERDKTKNDWVHAILQRKNKIKEFKLTQCLYGLNQINRIDLRRNKLPTIVIVESAKTASIMTALCPQSIWMSTEGLSGLNKTKLQPIKRFPIILFPDLPKKDQNPYEKWSNIISPLNQNGYNIRISDLLIKKSNELGLIPGADLADYI